jgi:hypothetical protein
MHLRLNNIERCRILRFIKAEEYISLIDIDSVLPDKIFIDFLMTTSHFSAVMISQIASVTDILNICRRRFFTVTGSGVV